MRKGKKEYSRKRYKPNRKKDALDDYDIKNFMVDNAIIASFDSLDRSKRDWIITTRYELQDSSPISERRLGLFFIKKGFTFIHQRPFVVNGKIYFLDYYLPLQRIAIEVDGQSHNYIFSKENDTIRNDAFSTIGIKTYRISSDETRKEKYIDTFLRAVGVKFPNKPKVNNKQK